MLFCRFWLFAFSALLCGCTALPDAMPTWLTVNSIGLWLPWWFVAVVGGVLTVVAYWFGRRWLAVPILRYLVYIYLAYIGLGRFADISSQLPYMTMGFVVAALVGLWLNRTTSLDPVREIAEGRVGLNEVQRYLIQRINAPFLVAWAFRSMQGWSQNEFNLALRNWRFQLATYCCGEPYIRDIWGQFMAVYHERLIEVQTKIERLSNDLLGKYKARFAARLDELAESVVTDQDGDPPGSGSSRNKAGGAHEEDG